MSLRSQPAFDTYDRPALDGPMCIPRRVHECTCAAYQGQCNKFTLCDPSSLCCPAPRVPMSCEALTTRRMPADRATAIVTVLGFNSSHVRPHTKKPLASLHWLRPTRHSSAEAAQVRRAARAAAIGAAPWA